MKRPHPGTRGISMLLTTDTVVTYQLPNQPVGYAHLRVFTPRHRWQRPVIVLGEPLDNPGPPIMAALIQVVALVRADFLPDRCRQLRVLTYHPDPKGTGGWFTTVALWHRVPSRCLLPWGRVITHDHAERTTGCPLVTPPATSYTVAGLRTRRRR